MHHVYTYDIRSKYRTVCLHEEELKKERVREVLRDMGMPEDSIEIAIEKNMFYAFKNEAMKDFSTLIKLVDAQNQAEVLKKNLKDLTDIHEDAIKDGMRRYLRDKFDINALLLMDEDELRDEVLSYFGHSGKFTVYTTRAYYRSSPGTTDKSIFVLPFVSIRFSRDV